MIYKILSAVFAATTIVFLLLWLLGGNIKDMEIVKLTSERDACWNTPHKVDTVHDTVVIYSERVIHPKPVPRPSETLIPPAPDTLKCTKFYDETYKKDGVRIHYQLQTYGCSVTDVAFPDMVFPRDIIYETKTVDTCIAKPPAYKPKNHIGMEVGVIGKNFKDFPGVSLGMFYSFKDKWAVDLGGQYMDKNFYGKVGIKIYFR